MTVEKLIKVLEKCDKNSEVFFEETTADKDGIYSVCIVNSVYEVALKEKEQWKPLRVVFSSME